MNMAMPRTASTIRIAANHRLLLEAVFSTALPCSTCSADSWPRRRPEDAPFAV
jgi:hypothetical protein